MDIELTETQSERIESLRAELESKTSTYATVTPQDTVEYLLDIAAEIDNPSPESAPLPSQVADTTITKPFPRAALREQLEARRLSHSDSDEAEQMDLYTIAVEFDIEGRSSMQKAEIINAILDIAEQRYTNPFASVDIEFPTSTGSQPEQTDSISEADSETEDVLDDSKTTDEAVDEDNTESTDSDTGQLDAMLSLMETHNDKWWSSEGDARYKVELPDGSVESARTKDDVRAMLFKNY